MTSNGQSIQRFSGWGISMLKERPDCGYVLGRDYDRLSAELERYKHALWAANGFLIQLNREPVKLEYPAETGAKLCPTCGVSLADPDHKHLAAAHE